MTFNVTSFIQELDDGGRATENIPATSVVVLDDTQTLQDIFSVSRIHGTDVVVAAAGRTLGAALKASVWNYRINNKGSADAAASTSVSTLKDILMKNEKNLHVSVIKCSYGAFSDLNDGSAPGVSGKSL